METTDFAKYLTAFFSQYLVAERGVSFNTIRSYSNTFTQLLVFMDENQGIKAEKISLGHLTRKVILSFLDWLQDDRKSTNATRNQRLAALRSFFAYMQYEDTKRIAQWQEILSIKVKKNEHKSVDYLSVEAIKFLLEQIPTHTKSGRRNLALIALLYDTGARVQELIDLTVSSVKMNKPYCITLWGKGNKKRIVPLAHQQVKLLESYMAENNLNTGFNQRPLFANNRGGKLTNSGITYILNTFAHHARMLKPELIPDRISPHTLRHSKAMHLLQAGVNLVYIRDILGHVSIQTTEVYARADSKQKREALEAAYENVIPNGASERSWEKDTKLKIWLKSLAK